MRVRLTPLEERFRIKYMLFLLQKLVVWSDMRSGGDCEGAKYGAEGVDICCSKLDDDAMDIRLITLSCKLIKLWPLKS